MFRLNYMPGLNQRGVIHLLVPLILLAGIIVGVYLVQQHTSFFPKAASPSRVVSINSLIAEERKVAEINEEGKLSKERAEFLAYVAPETFQEFVQQGLIENPDKIKKPERLTREDLNSISTVSRTALTAPSISSCGEITSSGNYSLTQDISSDGGVCIYIHNTQNVNLDCQNHSITATYNRDISPYGRAVIIDNVQNFSAKNCSSIQSIYRTDYPNPTFALQSIEIYNSSTGSIQNNTIQGGPVHIEDSNNLQISNNTVNTSYYQYRSSFVQIRDNEFKIKAVEWYVPATVISSWGGSNNTIENNTVDGAWDGIDAHSGYIGADDGIFIGTETGDVISGNRISNNYDCGIETAGYIKDTIMTNNQIYNSGLCGIGGWFGHSWLNNTVDSNVVDGSAYMFYFFLYGFFIPDQPYIYFKDNTFSNNTFLNQRSSSYIGSTRQYSSLIDFQNLDLRIPPSSLQLGNNVFRNNNFGQTIPSPVFMPAGIIVDQGGNKCMPYNDDLPRPLVCSNAIPSPSPTPRVSILSLSLKLPGIGDVGTENRNPQRRERAVNLWVLDGARNQVSAASASLTFDSNNFVGATEVGNIPQGSYYVKVKLDNSLSKLLNNGQPIIISPGTPIATQSATLLVGDVNNDNNINISDFIQLRSCFFKNTSSPQWNTCQASDFNDDGRISVTDYSRLVTNFNQRGE